MIILEVFSLHHVSLVLIASEGVRRMSIITLIIYIREVMCGRRQGQHFLPLTPVSSTLYYVDGSIFKKEQNPKLKKSNFRLKVIIEFKLLPLILAIYITIISIFLLSMVKF